MNALKWIVSYLLFADLACLLYFHHSAVDKRNKATMIGFGFMELVHALAILVIWWS